MWGELRTTYFRGNEGGRGPLSFDGAARFWLGNFRLAREIFGEPFGSLDAGAPADFIILENFQKTPLTTDTWLGHLLFDFHPWDIHAVYVGGRRVYLNGDSPPVDGQAAAGDRQPDLENHGDDLVSGPDEPMTRAIARLATEREDAMVAFLRDIVAIRSLSGEEEAVVRRIAREMEQLGFDEVKIDALGNVLGRVGARPPCHRVRRPRRHRGRHRRRSVALRPLRGQGRGRQRSTDAAPSTRRPAWPRMVYAAVIMQELDLLEGFQVWMVGSVMEEDCDGLCWHHILSEKTLSPELVVSTEPTGLKIHRGQRGRMEIRVRVKGRSCHGSMPHLGDNAIYKINPAIAAIARLNDRLADDPFLGKGTCTITWIGCQSPSLCAVPDEAEFHIDRRLTAGETRESALAEVEARAGAKPASTPRSSPSIYEEKAWTGLVYPMDKYYPTWTLAEDHPRAWPRPAGRSPASPAARPRSPAGISAPTA